MKILLNLFVICVLLTIAGCQSDAISTETVIMPTLNILPTSIGNLSPTLQYKNNEGDAMSDPTINPDPNAQKMVQLAKESLARKFKINEDQINLFSVEAMNWPDASLGCPQAEIVYAQVITPGFQILFESIGQSYSYHTDNIDRVILCQIHPPDNIFPTPE